MNTAAKLLTGAALPITAALIWAVFSPTLEPPAAAGTPFRTAVKASVSRPAPALQAPVHTPAAETTRLSTGLGEAESAALAKIEALLAQEHGSADAALAPLRAWAEKDPAAAAQWVTANLKDGARRRALTEVIALWAARSPLEALAWLDAQPTSEGNEEPYTAALATLSAGDAPAAAAWIQQHPDLASRENYEVLLSHWTTVDPDAAAAWLRAFPNAVLREALLPTVLSGLRDSGAAAALVRDTQPENPDAALAAATTGQGSAQYALDLAAQISDASTREAITQNVLQDIASADSDLSPAAVEPAPAAPVPIPAE